MFLTLFFWLLMGFSTAYFAQQRGRNPYLWFIIGIFFGLLGLLFVFLLPVVNADGSGSGFEEKDIIKGEDSSGDSPDFFAPSKSHDFFIKDWFYLDSQSKQYGPISFDLLKKLVEEEKIQRSSYVWCVGMTGWKRIEEFDELKALLVAD
jgi:hypothetical protein